jgi:excisionase family DNA binding protein
MNLQTQFMTVEEVAKYLRLAPITIYRLAEKKDLPGHKAGLKWRFIQSEVDEWLKWRRK